MRQPDRDRIAVLKRYLQDREDIHTALYRLIESGAAAEVSASEIETLCKAITAVSGKPWCVTRELEELEKKARP